MSRSARRSRPAGRCLAATALAVPLLLTGHAAAADDPAPGRPGVGDRYFPTYGNGGYDVRHYDVAVRFDPATDRLVGHATLDVTATSALSRFDLDLVGLTVRALTVDGERATWTRSGAHELVVTPARPLRRGQQFSVDVRYDGKPQTFSDPALGTYAWLNTGDGAIAIGEPEVAAYWFPVNDHPSDKATYRIRITAPKGLQSISNGLDATRTVTGDWATTTWTPRDPMASYLAFVAIGEFDVHRWRTASGIPVIDAVDSGIQGPLRRRIESSFAKQGEMLAAEQQWFGPYPFETAGGVVDRVDVGFALENQTRPTYSPDFWNYPDFPTLGDVVVVHELAHQWYGDSVALNRWQDVWLNEGFATYAEWLWNEREYGFTPQEQFDAVYGGTPADSPFWQVAPGDPGKALLFSGPVYTRGAMTLQALRREVGDQDFFAILRGWASSHRDGNGTTAGFIRFAENTSGTSLDALFQAWLYTPTKPAVPTAALTGSARAAQVTAAMSNWQAGLDARLARGQH